MNKYEQFVEYFNQMSNRLGGDHPPFVAEVLEELSTRGGVLASKPLFTETGLDILEYLQSHDTRLKAKDIAEGMEVSSRKISGAIRKLVTDGYVDKYGQNPVIYNLTQQGKDFDIIKYKETINNEKEC